MAILGNLNPNNKKKQKTKSINRSVIFYWLYKQDKLRKPESNVLRAKKHCQSFAGQNRGSDRTGGPNSIACLNGFNESIAGLGITFCLASWYYSAAEKC